MTRYSVGKTQAGLLIYWCKGYNKKRKLSWIPETWIWIIWNLVIKFSLSLSLSLLCFYTFVYSAHGIDSGSSDRSWWSHNYFPRGLYKFCCYIFKHFYEVFVFLTSAFWLRCVSSWKILLCCVHSVGGPHSNQEQEIGWSSRSHILLLKQIRWSLLHPPYCATSLSPPTTLLSAQTPILGKLSPHQIPLSIVYHRIASQ